jgi:hypothetical protein
MSTGKTQLIGGGFQDAEGNAVANGSLVMELVQDEQLTSSQGQSCGGIKITLILDSNGNVSGTSGDGGSAQSVWPTDQMNPTGASYTAWVYTANGQLAWGPNYNLMVPSSPNPYNIDNWVPNSASSGSGSDNVGSILLQTNGVSNPVQNVENLIAGANITLTADGAGGTTITSSATASVPIVFASSYGGATWGAKVQAADTAYSGTPVEIWVEQTANVGALAADLTLSAGHVLRFSQGGTYDLSTYRILVSGSSANVAIIGSSPWGTNLTYSGSDYPIRAGDNGSYLLEYFLLQDICVTVGASALGGLYIQQNLWSRVERYRFVGAGASYSQNGLVLDGSGSATLPQVGDFSAYCTVVDPAILNFGGGVGILVTGDLSTAAANNSNQFIGGGVVGNAVSGSKGIWIKSGDTNNVMGTDFESVDIGVHIGPTNDNLMSQVRMEGIGSLYVKFDSGSARNTVNTITRAEFCTVSDAGFANSVNTVGTFCQSITNSGQVAYSFRQDTNAQPLTVQLIPSIPGGPEAGTFFEFCDRTGGTQFYFEKDSTNDFFLGQQGKNAFPLVVAANGAVGLNSNSGQLLFNSGAGASTSGVGFYSGGSTSEPVAAIDGSGNFSSNPAAAVTTSNTNSPYLKLSSFWSPINTAITAASVTSGVVTLSGNFTGFTNGLQVTPSGLSNGANTWLNGLRLTIVSHSGTQMTANVSHGDYGTTADTGTAYENEADSWTIQNVVGTGTTPTSTLTITHSGSNGAATIDLENVATDTSATAGSHGAVPAQVAGYLNITINGTAYKMPLFLP